MPTQIQLRRGTTAEHSTFTGAVSEVTVDTTKKTVVVHDGATAGGFPLLREASPTYTGALTGGTGIVNLGSGQFYKDASGNIGLGTSSPSTYGQLAVFKSSGDIEAAVVTGGANYATYRLQNSTNRYSMQIRTDQSNAWVLRDETNGANRFLIAAGSSEAMRIDSSGNLLVNTTSVISQGKGNIAFNGTGNQGFNLQETANQSSAGFMYFQHNATVLGTITRVATTSAVAFNTTSDVRLKENIAEANPALEAVSNIKVRQYDWIGTDHHQEYGFIAQELAEVVSDVVTKGRTEEDTWAVDYGKLTPILCKAIQEQQTLIENLTTRLNALEGK